MQNFSYHVPFYVVNGGVATSGHSSDLKGAQVGLFDRSTWNVATAIGNGKEFFFAQGVIGGKDWYGHPVTESSHKSPFFYGKDVENMYLSLPKRIVNEEWVLGYNGAASSVSLKFQKAKPFRIKFIFTGEPTYRFFNGPKEYVVSYTPTEDCTEPCAGSDCPEDISDCLTHTQEVVNRINNHTELHKFGVSAKIVVNPYSATSTNMTKYCLTLCDNGDGVALKAVEAQAPTGSVVTRTLRSGSSSTYEICIPDGDSAPADFQQTGSVLQAVCDECPEDSFLIPAKDVFIVRRPIVGGEDFSTAASRDTYANVVWSAYATSESITSTTSTTSTTTAAGTFNADATFVGNDGAVAIVKLKFPAGTELDPVLGADIVEFSHTEPALCVFDTPAATAWTECGTGIRGTRTLKISGINRPDCDAEGDRLDDIESILAGVKGIDIESLDIVAGTACADDYTVDQFSIDCLSEEECQTNVVTFTYDELPGFEGKAWEVVPPTVVENESRKCGIRITAGYYDPRFGDCSFNPKDYYETMPVKFEVSILEEDGDRCDAAAWPTQLQTRRGQISRQSGEWVVREVIMKTDAYIKHIKQFDLEPRMREAFDMNLLASVDRNAFYNLYYITYKSSMGQYTYRKNEQEEFTTVFAFKEGDSSRLSFETNVIDVLTAKSGVSMHIND